MKAMHVHAALRPPVSKRSGPRDIGRAFPRPLSGCLAGPDPGRVPDFAATIDGAGGGIRPGGPLGR
jgi:hypothetical protein